MAWLVLPRTHANRVLLALHFPRLLEHVLEPAHAEASAATPPPYTPPFTSLRAASAPGPSYSTLGASGPSSTSAKGGMPAAGRAASPPHAISINPSVAHAISPGLGSRLQPTSRRVLLHALREGNARRRALRAKSEQAARLAAIVRARSGVPHRQQQLRVGKRMQHVRRRMLVIRRSTDSCQQKGCGRH